MARMEFEARLVPSKRGSGGAWVELPPETSDVFDTRARFPIIATFNGVSYRGSTMPMGDGTFCVGLTRAVQSAAGVEVGDVVHVVIARDDGERTVDVPTDFAQALDQAGIRKRFDGMAFTHRKEYVRWIEDAKLSETRLRRIATAVSMIGEGKPFS